jgi:hypothetical protein
MRRRTLGIAALLFMANATFATTATACLMTGDGAAHTPSTAATGGAHHQHHAASPVAEKSSTDAPSNTPSHTQPIPSCCKAVAPCSSAVAAASIVEMAVSSAYGVLIAALGELAPESRLDAPDTPPPKA